MIKKQVTVENLVCAIFKKKAKHVTISQKHVQLLFYSCKHGQVLLLTAAYIFHTSGNVHE